MHDSRSGIPLTVFWLLAIWVVLVLGALAWGIDNAESKLRVETSEVLSDSGANLAFDVSGRDVTLYGTVTTEEEGRVLASEVDAIPGVRRVKNALVATAPEVPPPTPPEVSMRIVGDAVSISGLVPTSETAAAIVEAANEAYGDDRVVDGLVVDDNVETQPWLVRISGVFEYLHELRSGGFVADESAFTLNGEAISEASKARIEEDVQLVLDDLIPVVSNLEVAVLPAPTFHAEGSDGIVTLQGELPDEETVSRIVEAAQRLHAGSTIVNNLRVGEVAGPMWLESINGLLDVATRLNSWTIDIDAGVVTITGLTLDQELVGAIEVLAEEVVDGQLEVSTDIEVDPSALAIELTRLAQAIEMFGPNDATLTPEAQDLLDEAIPLIKAAAPVALVVGAYTDDLGDEGANLELSQQQAEAVVAYLVAGGVGRGRLTAIGYGESLPIADNATEAGRAQNRRIEFTIEEGGG